METVVTAALIIAVIALRVAMRPALALHPDGQPHMGTTPSRYGRALPGFGRLRARNRRAAKPSPAPADASPALHEAALAGTADDLPPSPAGTVGGPGGRHRPVEAPEPPAAGKVDVRLVASSPEAARMIAEILRSCFASSEQRSYPVGRVAGGTRLHLTVDTTRAAEPARSWLVTSRRDDGV